MTSNFVNLNPFSEERTSSTHALTMYRYQYDLNGK